MKRGMQQTVEDLYEAIYYEAESQSQEWSN